MRIKRIITVTLSIGLLILLSRILKGSDDMITQHDATIAIASEEFTPKIPLIDTKAPLKTETATFALG
jgi:hypothetical protein